MYWIVALIGTAELAAASVLINVTLIALLPGIALGISAATLVGQSAGARRAGRRQAMGVGCR